MIPNLKAFYLISGGQEFADVVHITPESLEVLPMGGILSDGDIPL